MCYRIILTAIFCMIVSVANAQDELVKATNLDKLNTAGDEEDPCPTPDGKELLYATSAKGSYGIYISKRAMANAPFGPGKVFIFDKLSDQRCPMKFQDKYYFASNEVPDEKFAKLRNFDILTQVGTQRPFRLLGEINTKADEMYPWVTPAGKELYFSRKVDGGWKLFVANGPVPGPIGKAKEVGFPVNYHRATVAGKGLVMYLQGPLEDGKIGIFRSSRDKVGDAWSKPAVVAGLNHPDSKKGDMQPALSADGSRLYFVSDRPGGKGGLDIWTVPTASLK
jgi:WD40-like Beta Propeller Repeat